MTDQAEEIAAIEDWVRALLTSTLPSGPEDITQVVARPGSEAIACTLAVRDGDDPSAVRHRVAVVDLESKRCHVLDLDADSVSSPAWSPDGRRLCVLATVAQVTTAWIVGFGDDEAGTEVVGRLPGVGGAVEQAVWSPDGARLGLVVAQFGAEVSDVHGSGTVAGPDGSQSWRPIVSPAPEGGRRVLHVWEPTGGGLTSPRPELNVWEAAWLGPDRLLALASEDAGEGAWYAARVHAIGLDGTTALVHVSPRQLAAPSGSPSGRRWAVLEARASDRGLLAGALVVGAAGGEGAVVDTAGVDVTAMRWLDEGRIGYAGLRGLDTVFGIVDVTTAACTELLAGSDASGLHQPEAGALTDAGTLACVLERHDRPPALTVVRDGLAESVLSTADDGTRRLGERIGTTVACSWTSSDGWEIEGLLTCPPGEEPHALVVDVHGGPVAAWRDGWLGKDRYVATLVARGFAVLRPNLRGSAGRGAAFAEAIVGDMGGRDMDDVITGVAAMIERGVTEAGRVGITGNSYGGFMAAWIPCWSEVFAAAVSRSPVTDWRSQHLTGNLAAFDELFVGGDPFDAESAYRTRSPLTFHDRIRTPMLFTAGAHDLATPASQAQQLHHALLRRGVPTQLALYPEEGHGVRQYDALCDQLARVIWWFETYLTGDRSPQNGGVR